jgi:protein gp37
MTYLDHPTTRAELEKLWPLIRSTPQLDWLLLTKRPERIAMSLADDWGAGFPNVWLGTTIETSEHVGRADLLRAVPTYVRFISAEPLLDDVDGLDLRGIHWLIAGGESGVGARAVEESWLHGLRVRCDRANVAFFFKQWGGVIDARGHDAAVVAGRRWTDVPPPHSVSS